MRKKTSIVWEYPKEEFLHLVNSSVTYADLIRKVGLTNKGNNFKTVKRRIDEEGINADHLIANKFKCKSKPSIPLDKILVINSSYNGFNLKNRLISEGIIEYKCNDCGLSGDWNGKPLKLQLEHKNGVSNDNRLENLCLLCPNCHSQTSTYAGKNAKRIKKIKSPIKCVKCGNRLKTCSNNELCRKCSNINRRKVKRPTKEQILEDIKELGYCGTGRKYGVSDNAVRKWLK